MTEVNPSNTQLFIGLLENMYLRSGYCPGGRVSKKCLSTFSDVEKPVLSSDLAALTVKLENKKAF